MAITPIGHRPELRPDQAFEVFAKHFAGTYEVYATKARNRDFIVKKDGWSGVGVRLKQESDKTSFVYTAMMPNLLLQLLFGGLVSYLFLRSTWKKLEAEVAEFIEAAPEFHPKAKAQRSTKAAA